MVLASSLSTQEINNDKVGNTMGKIYRGGVLSTWRGEHHAADLADNFDGTYDVPVKWPSLYCTEWCAPYRKMSDSASVWNVMGVSLLASFLEPVNIHRFGAEHSSLSFTLLIPCLLCLNYPASSMSPSGSFFYSIFFPLGTRMFMLLYLSGGGIGGLTLAFASVVVVSEDFVVPSLQHRKADQPDGLAMGALYSRGLIISLCMTFSV